MIENGKKFVIPYRAICHFYEFYVVEDFEKNIGLLKDHINS